MLSMLKFKGGDSGTVGEGEAGETENDIGEAHAQHGLGTKRES